MIKVYADKKLHIQDIDNKWDNIGKATDFVKTIGNLKFLWKFHNFLQISVSHYTLEEESSERLMLKYYEYLLKLKEFLKNKYLIDVLGNIDKFPLNTDSTLNEYYERIADKVNQHRPTDTKNVKDDSYYIQKIKPFFVNQKIYYEVTFTPVNEKASKFDRAIAFTNLDISSYYSARLFLVDETIDILGQTMPMFIIVNWETWIRPCEIKNFSRITGNLLDAKRSNPEYRKLMQYLTDTGLNLVDIVDFSDEYFQNVKLSIIQNAKSTSFFDVLEQCREIIRNNKAGSNVLRYLLYHLKNRVIKEQINSINEHLSGLYLNYGCIPFDDMPFNSSLISHNPKLWDVFDCINPSDRKHELFARLIIKNTEINGQLFTPIKDISDFDNIETLKDTYNKKLYYKHQGRKIEINKGHIYIKEYKDDTQFIIGKLNELAIDGVLNYTNSVNSWLQSNVHVVDCEEKKYALAQMFEKSKVAVIYGSAGTGKSTLINHLSHFISDKSKLFLANTNPAVDNMKIRVTASNCEFSTIAKFLKRKKVSTEYDLLIIDECSTVSNRDMRGILEKITCKLLVLVGDIFQIESIQFGNWFSTTRSFIPATSIFELTKPYRSNNEYLLTLWKRVRNMDETVLELIAKQGYSTTLDASIFKTDETDEIILCLNYDGLYGINNINRFLQENNPNKAVYWGLQLYKVNDPILFNESERFSPLIYKNMKGKVVRIVTMEKQIQFDIELDKVINGMDADDYDGLTLLDNSENGNSVIQFSVDKYKKITDDDDDGTSSTVVPFQVAYAVSIHKAQGLEYNSVKIVISDEIDELITHNIFYTAITRAREKLKIYWTPEVENKVLSSIKPKDYIKDVALLKAI